MKKVVRLFIVLALMSLLFSCETFAEEITEEIDMGSDEIDAFYSQEVNTVIDEQVGTTILYSGTHGKGFTWAIDSEGTMIISGNGKMDDFPDSSDRPWDIYRDEIKKVVFKGNITHIGVNFALCNNLTSILIPSSVETTNGSLFPYCEKLITAGPIGSGCNIEFGWKSEIPNEIFRQCIYLQEITIPNGMTKIGDYEFTDCINLSRIIIPSTITEKGIDIFSNCAQLKTAGPVGSGCNIEFGWKDRIPDSFFCGLKSLQSVTLPEGLVKIERNAFSYCENLSKIYVPSSVVDLDQDWIHSNKIKTAGPAGSRCDFEYGWNERIPDYAFRGCAELTNIKLPQQVTSIGKGAFFGCISLNKIIIPSNKVDIGEGVFSGCSEIKTAGPIGSGCNMEFAGGKTLPEGLFNCCFDLEEVILPSTLEVIEDNLFKDCFKLSKISIPDGVTKIGESAFANCFSLSQLSIPNGVCEIGDLAFANCNRLKSINIPDSVYEIGNSAFGGCESLESIDVPQNVKVIRNGTFSGCTGLKKITFSQELEEILGASFWNCNNLVGSITFPKTLKAIGDGAFYNTGVEEIVINEGTKAIYGAAFTECTNLKKITIPTSVKIIGWTCFENTNVTIYGYTNSIAHEHAKIVNIPFVSLGEYDPEKDKVYSIFSDVSKNAWYVDAIQYVYDNDIMSGTTATTFEPDKPCTRAMMVTILYSSMGKPLVSGTTSFVDLKANWYKSSVLWAYQNNITKGQTDTTFAPDKNVARQEMAVFLHSFAKYRGYNTSAAADLNKFIDISQLSSWAAPQMQWANANGIINGKGGGKLDPKGNATRAEVAAMIMSFQYKFGK